MKTNGGAVLPVPDTSTLLGALLSNADLLKVTVTKVLQPLLDILSPYAKFHFSGLNLVMSRVQNTQL